MHKKHKSISDGFWAVRVNEVLRDGLFGNLSSCC